MVAISDMMEKKGSLRSSFDGSEGVMTREKVGQAEETASAEILSMQQEDKRD